MQVRVAMDPSLCKSCNRGKHAHCEGGDCDCHCITLMNRDNVPQQNEFAVDTEPKLSHMLASGRIARQGKQSLPKHIGCLVLTFEQHGRRGHMGYASTGEREDCIRVLHEFLANFEGN